ncbi:MAG: hypothetical protein NZ930_01735 [Candidatus Bipolaricaulota bacterium]|nr:hypothetical protein [Candidatus Bipolaricaulota bacterium]MDW8030205.1 hypothetical protein [Candidatus Bipolaricaulota bacterium]
MAYVSKKDLIDKLNPLLDDLVEQRNDLETAWDEMDRDTIEDLLDRMERTIQQMRTAIDEAKD